MLETGEREKEHICTNHKSERYCQTVQDRGIFNRGPQCSWAPGGMHFIIV